MPSVERKVKKEGANFGKAFYSCSKNQDDATRCNMFQWKDEVLNRPREALMQLPPQQLSQTTGHFANVSTGFVSTPNCSCGLPSVERVVKKEGANCGKAFFVCSKNQDDPSRCNTFEVFFSLHH
jgi:hypothetical protein